MADGYVAGFEAIVLAKWKLSFCHVLWVVAIFSSLFSGGITCGKFFLWRKRIEPNLQINNSKL